MKQLRGKVGVVTGGASGIGRALCEELASAGMDVVVSDIDQLGAERVAGELRKRGRRAIAVRTDVTQPADLEALLQETLQQLGGCHLIANNAGIAFGCALLDTSDEQWQKTIDVDLWGVIYGSRVFGRHFRQQRLGHIVNVASCAGQLGVPGLGAYSAAKFGVVGLTQALRWELAAHGVGVTAVCPGFLRTNLVVAAGEHAGLLRETRKAPTPEGLAPRIVQAVRKDQPQVLYGREAYLVQAALRLPEAVRDRVGKWLARDVAKAAGQAG